MHNAAIAELNMDWRYLAFDVAPSNLRDAIAGAKAMKFIGLNLTVPHKLLALDFVDELDSTARTWGAVNTIRFEARSATGGWTPLHELPAEQLTEIRTHGFNTDADAIVRALREDLGLEPNGATVLLLGAGGAGRVAALKLAAENARELFLVNRTQEKAEQIAREISERYPGCKTHLGYPARAVDLILNATSLGLRSTDHSPLDASQFQLSKARCVYDMIYRPAETQLLQSAKAAGCRTANGLGMLLYQGAKALELWSGRPAPVPIMRRALEQNIYG